MMSFKNVQWAATNQYLLEAVAKAAGKDELIFKCPFFGTTHAISPLKLTNGVECRHFRYRGYKYYLAKSYNKHWKCDFWTLGMINTVGTKESFRSNPVHRIMDNRFRR